MSFLKVEGKAEIGDPWTFIVSLKPGDRQGSISDNSGICRQVIMFRCHEGFSVVGVAPLGVDRLVMRGVVREITDISLDGIKELARLTPGKSYVTTVLNDAGMELLVRWTHVEE